MFVHQRKRGDVSFDFSITVADNRKDHAPKFGGDFVQAFHDCSVRHVGVVRCAGWTPG